VKRGPLFYGSISRKEGGRRFEYARFRQRWGMGFRGRNTLTPPGAGRRGVFFSATPSGDKWERRGGHTPLPRFRFCASWRGGKRRKGDRESFLAERLKKKGLILAFAEGLLQTLHFAEGGKLRRKKERPVSAMNSRPGEKEGEKIDVSS